MDKTWYCISCWKWDIRNLLKKENFIVTCVELKDALGNVPSYQDLKKAFEDLERRMKEVEFICGLRNG